MDELLIDHIAIPENRGQTQTRTRAQHTLDDTGEDKQGTQEEGRGRATTKDTMEKYTNAPLCPTQTQHITDPTTNDIGVIDLIGNRAKQDDICTKAEINAE